MSDATAITEFWDSNVGKHRDDFHHSDSVKAIADFISFRIAGSDAVSPFVRAVETYGPFDTIAEVGCGDGSLLTTLASRWPNSSYHGFDISPGSLALAKQNCAAFTNTRMEFNTVDLNVERLPHRSFDAIFATGTMHHIEKQDFAFASLAACLRPRGVLVLNDYFGPARMQWSDTTLRLGAELLAMVPQKWRLRDQIWKHKASEIEAMDPSETVASHQMNEALIAHFNVLERHYKPGTLLGPIFGTGALSPEMRDTQEGRQTLRVLVEVEADMVDRGVLQPDGFFVVASPRRNTDTLVADLFNSRWRGLSPKA